VIETKKGERKRAMRLSREAKTQHHEAITSAASKMLQALAGMDDPRGEVEHLRRALSTGAVAAVSPANAPQTE
jgi:hypothetical protein